MTAGGRTQVAEIHSGRSYQSHFGSRLHFGLAASDRIDQIQVQWLGGDRQTFTDPPANRLVVLKQETGDPTH